MAAASPVRARRGGEGGGRAPGAGRPRGPAHRAPPGHPDGALGAAFVLIDTVDTLRSALRVLCRGQIGGPSIGVVAAADDRAAALHARFHLSQPTARFAGTPEEIAAQSRQQQELLWKLYGRLARRTNRPAEEIAEDMRRGRYLDAREALEYGLIDEIIAGR